MKPVLIISAILLSASVSAHATADAPQQPQAAPGTHVASHQIKKPMRTRNAATQSSSNVVTYNRDSKDPNVGWHWEGGMRVCHNDCDNPEIPGSGYTCRNVQFLGMPMRECDSSSW